MGKTLAILEIILISPLGVAQSNEANIGNFQGTAV